MIPFIGPSYSLNTAKADIQRSVNLFPVTNEVAGGKTEAYLQSIPGLDAFSPVADPDLGCRNALAAAEQAETTDSVYIYTDYGGGFSGSHEGTYFGVSTDGPPTIPFTFPFTQTWASLLEQDAPVTVFSGTRAGGGTDTVTATITVTDVDSQPIPICRACVVQTSGGWAGFTVVLPGGATQSPARLDGGVSGGYYQSVFILQNNNGVVTGEFIS